MEHLYRELYSYSIKSKKHTAVVISHSSLVNYCKKRLLLYYIFLLVSYW